jgi:hypothetical protein
VEHGGRSRDDLFAGADRMRVLREQLRLSADDESTIAAWSTHDGSRFPAAVRAGGRSASSSIREERFGWRRVSSRVRARGVVIAVPL